MMRKWRRHILSTPLAQTFLFAPGNAIGFIGAAGPWSDTDEIMKLSDANHIPLTVYDGCNHSLECNDTLKNIENLKDIMQRAKDFCKGCWQCIKNSGKTDSGKSGQCDFGISWWYRAGRAGKCAFRPIWTCGDRWDGYTHNVAEHAGKSVEI